MSYLLYNILGGMAYGAAAPVLHGLRRTKGREWEERLGYVDLPPSSSGRIWIHAASVGELAGVPPLVERIHEQDPEREIVLSTLTRTGQSIAQNMEGVAGAFYMPLDAPRVIRRAMQAVDAKSLILMETEIWPGFIREAYRRGMKTALVNGRISGGSFRYYRLFRGFLADVLEAVDFFGVQSERDRERFAHLGAPPERIRILGSSKYDAVPVRGKEMLARTLRGLLGDRADAPIWVAGCVRPGEEHPILDAYRSLDGERPLTLVLAPRHLEQVPGLESILAKKGLRWARWTAAGLGDGEGGPPQVVVLDTIGELGGFYGVAAVAFVGGGMVSLGGHNPLEPAAYGVPVLFGRHMDNYRLAADRLLDARGGVEVDDAGDITRVLEQWLRDRELCAESGRLALGVVEEFRGAAKRYVDALADAGILDEDAAAINGPPNGRTRCNGPREPWRAGPRVVVSGRWEPPRAVRGFVSRLHQGASAANRWVYRREFRRTVRLEVPVVSVGNLSLGGTGKTPLVALLARRFTSTGLKVGVLSRGYARSRPGAEPLVVSNGRGPEVSWVEAGDEPYWVASRIPEAAVLVGKDRVASGHYAQTRLGCRVMILDDGFQHRRLQRNLDIVTVDEEAWSSRGVYAGTQWLREGLRALASAHVVVLKRPDSTRPSSFGSYLEHRFPHLLVAETRHCPVGLYELATEREVPLSAVKGETVSSVCGLALPGGFEATVAGLGAKLNAAWRYPDHYVFKEADLEGVVRQSTPAARWILTTEKDAVRLRDFAGALENWLVLRIQPEMTARGEDFYRIVDNVLGAQGRRGGE